MRIEIATKGEVATKAEHIFYMQISDVDSVVRSSKSTDTTITETTAHRTSRIGRRIIVVGGLGEHAPASYGSDIFINVGLELEANLAFSSCIIVFAGKKSPNKAVIAVSQVGVSNKHVA